MALPTLIIVQNEQLIKAVGHFSAGEALQKSGATFCTMVRCLLQLLRRVMEYAQWLQSDGRLKTNVTSVGRESAAVSVRWWPLLGGSTASINVVTVACRFILINWASEAQDNFAGSKISVYL